MNCAQDWWDRTFNGLEEKCIGKTIGFTLLELVVTISIIAVLAGIAVPTYLNTQSKAKARVSLTNLMQIKQAFINHFYSSILDHQPQEFPPEPADNEMTVEWAKNTILYNGNSVAQLFSGGKIAINPYDNPYLYYILSATETEEEGFKLEDPDIGIVVRFRP